MSRSKKIDDAILQERIEQNKLNYPKMSLYLVALFVFYQPVFYSRTFNGLDWAKPLNIVLHLLVGGSTTFMLEQAYEVMVESKFWSLQRHFAEVNEKDESTLRRLRLQVALGYSLFLVNTLFFTVCTLFMAYIFRHSDPRANFILSPLITSSLLWFVAQENEVRRRGRMRKHK